MNETATTASDIAIDVHGLSKSFGGREVVSRGLAGMRAMIELGIARGEIQNKDLARFPQILVAPAMIAVIWQSLFSKHAPLDAIEMLQVHLDLIFGERRPT